MSAGAKAFFKKAGLPAIGFGIGWGGFTVVEQNGLLSEPMQRWLNLHNLKLQLYTQRLLPTSVVEKYGYPEDRLRSIIELLEKGYNVSEVAERMTFDEVLRQCAVPEQVAYLEEHAAEEIPYFYIADIFHSWANLNVNSFVRQPPQSPGETETDATTSTSAVASAATSPPLVLRNDDAFDSEVLCSSLWEKMIHSVIPFDVSIRALCVLAVNNRANARRLARLSSPERVAELYSEYMDKIQVDQRQGIGPDVVSPEEVTAATLFFLRAVNDALVHRRWIPLLGVFRPDPYPLARKVSSESWCRAFGNLTPAVTGATSETAVVLADVMNERLRCVELRKVVTAPLQSLAS
ncbi:conserved hypothetical protein [Leishmania mexicana MHOM/GT/2001/U1103]|uniref:Uncharacterized protein n=1 Tax=Leishmania mexicana (strain MHOM/GT/2001/U1103) TaxID=929439 RepID=E9B724_LEIMU|nr:conserved hypothetical protein [Leishmania mexicana MHOM/GT/2001/U1103]CBZ31047.1 conserved hypothetical protein [Leishmania mexicana MHOM/GT/2001/U1103]